MDNKLDGDDSSGFKTVVIHRTNKGYGLIVSGESPVSVQDVRDGGPADMAGIKKGDALIMVNDTPVSKLTHLDVVNIIKSTQKVKLTLRSCKESETTSETSHKLHQGIKSSDLITAPLPVDTQIQTKLEFNRAKTLHMFLDRQTKVRDNIISELQKGPTKVMQRNLERELESTNRQITKIMEEIKNMKDGEIQLQSSSRSSPHSPPLLRNVGPHPSTHSNSLSFMSYHQLPPPPPLPARSRNLTTQTSVPALPSNSFLFSLPPSASSSSNLPSMGATSPLTESPPPLPPRPPHLGGGGAASNALSLDNLPKTSNLMHSNSSGSDSSSTRHQTSGMKLSPDPGNSCVDSSIDGGGFNKGASVISGEEPPGTPPPPYGSITSKLEDKDDFSYSTVLDEASSPSMNIIAKENWTSSILTMEDEDGDVLTEDHGPFQSLTKLISMKFNAYMAVFINYVISNCDPSSLFFYIVTELYKDGGVKEMKKWAYEIHSSFLLPGAPMKLHNVDESVLYEIDETLQTGLDKEEILRKVFWKARQRSREDINVQLADFRSKRSAGLGSLFGPADHILEETIHNKVREIAVVEELLVPYLDSVSEDLKTQTDQMLIMASSLATILWKYFNVRSQNAQQLLDRFPLFVNKDRPVKNKILRGSKKQTVRDHHFTLMTFYSVNHCNHCGTIIWGIGPQGYQCVDCEMNIHKVCVREVEEVCVGQVHRVDSRSRDTKLGSFLQKIRPDEKERNRKSSHISAMQIDRARRGFEDGDIFGHILETEPILGDKANAGGLTKEQRRSDPCGGAALLNQAQNPSTGGSLEEVSSPSSQDDLDQGLLDSQPNSGAENSSNYLYKAQNVHKKRSATAINRSESCKEKQHARKQTRESRKNSDPNIPTSKAGDVDGDNLNFHSGSSSNSSLSQSQESPSGNSSEQVEAYASALDNDSDIEADADLPDWTQRVPPDVMECLSSKDRKRQDTINELFHTEQSHVRILKILQYLFHQPLRQSGYVSADILDQLFPNLDQMLKFHTNFNTLMKKRRQVGVPISIVGDVLSAMFESEESAQFQQAAAEFVACQGFGLESLKLQQKRDQKLAIFLQDQENHPHCRRLQLKDMLPAGFQRLSKYPLLLESIQSYTDRSKEPDEYDQISRALERSKVILAFVNAAVEDAENQRRLREIQKRLDQSSLAKNKHANCEELRGDLDLTKHTLIHEGPLTLKTARGQKNIDLHVLILADCVVLLQKDSEKYVLKYHSMNKSVGRDDNKLNLSSPIIKFGTFLCREVATDKCGIFIILTQSTQNAQIYELVATSAADRSSGDMFRERLRRKSLQLEKIPIEKGRSSQRRGSLSDKQVLSVVRDPHERRGSLVTRWLRHLHDAQASYNAREGRTRRSHVSPHDLDDSSATSELRDVDDGLDGDNSESMDAVGEKPDGSASSAPHTPPSPESAPKKTESGAETSSGVGDVSPQSSPTGLQKRSRRLQEVQIIQIVEGQPLIHPSEVIVSQGVVLSAEPVLTPIELLRRKDLKIKQELEEKQNLIADILNIPRQHFESLANIGEAGLSNKEARELVLGAIFQAQKLQEALNEAQTLRDSDIIAAQAHADPSSKSSYLPLYPGPMEKLLSISGSLTQLLNSLMNLITERDEERERMRKELIASRERLHQLHLQQQQQPPPEAATSSNISPHSSRPCSIVSVSSSAADQSDSADPLVTDEETRNEDRISSSICGTTSIIEPVKECRGGPVGESGGREEANPTNSDISELPTVEPLIFSTAEVDESGSST